MRLIDSDILADEIESMKISVSGRPATFDEAKSDVMQVIDEQKTVDTAELLRDKWISVEARLPEKDEKCIFFASGNNAAYIGQYDYTGRYGAVKFKKRDGRGTVLYTASHWMPLPELPEVDKP